MQFQDALDWLYATQQRGIKLGLENIRRLIESLEVDLGKGPRFIHVAGTNGKGSVCAMLDAMCRGAGLATGLFTSPHLVSFRERICVNGEMISENDVAALLTSIRKLIGPWKEPPTFFEITTALALWYFQDERVEIVVLETGLGGRLDSTNVVQPLVSVVTQIAEDHQQWLGHSLTEIAGEKAGILKPGRPAVSAPQQPEVEATLRKIARVRGAPLEFVTGPYEGEIGLAGSHQRLNAALAIRAAEKACLDLPQESIRRALKEVRWPGRFHRIGSRYVLDGAHNGAAAAALATTWREVFGSEKATVILGILRDKDLGAISRAILPVAARVITVPVRSARSADPTALADLLVAIRSTQPIAVSPDLSAGLSLAGAHPDRVLITGSLFLVGEAISLLEKEAAPLVSLQ